MTPLACGTHATSTTLTPWSTPEGADAHPGDSFATTGSCSASEAAAPKDASFTGGTVSPLAGAYSPFGLRISRPDGSQHITGIDTTLPEGLLGKLAGLSYCSDAQIAQAMGREAPEKGAEEQRDPSCPQSSELGNVYVTAGAGPNPIPVSGHAYLAGPYKGAPLSLAVIVPAVAGPFDLGTVVTRVALNIDPATAQIHAVSDPLPTIREGIPLDLRSVEVKLDRSNFTLNPTSCEAMAVQGSLSTQAEQSQPLKIPFRVGGCARLGFRPRLGIRLFARASHRGAHPRLKAVLAPRPGDASTRRVAAILPPSELLDNAHFRTICTRARYAAGAGFGSACPRGSVYGHARVWTPLLAEPLSGPVYLRSSRHLLPDLVLALRGQIEIEAVGRIDSVRLGRRRRGSAPCSRASPTPRSPTRSSRCGAARRACWSTAPTSAAAGTEPVCASGPATAASRKSTRWCGRTAAGRAARSATAGTAAPRLRAPRQRNGCVPRRRGRPLDSVREDGEIAGMMGRFRRAASRRSIAAAAVLLGCAALAVAGLGVEDRLQPTSLVVPGTSSARGQALADAHFGESSPFAVLLRGPAAAIERQGPRAGAGAARRPVGDGRLAVGPGGAGGAAAGAAAGDRPARLPPAAGHGDAGDRAGAGTHAGGAGAAAGAGDAVRVRERVAGAAERIAGGDRAGRADRRAAAADRAAARLPLGSSRPRSRWGSARSPCSPGAARSCCSDSVMTIEALALVVCTMMGLALGVDYSLFIVSRFREELARGAAAAARRRGRARARRAGRRCSPGATLFASILLSGFLQPGSLLLSLATGLVVVTPISVAISPWRPARACWPCWGERIDMRGWRWRRERAAAGGGRGRSRVAAAANAALRRPAAAAVADRGAAGAAGRARARLRHRRPRGSTSCPPRAPPGRAPKRSTRGRPGLGGAVRDRRSPPAKGRSRRRSGCALLARAQRRIAAQPGVRAVIGPAPIASGRQSAARAGAALARRAARRRAG